jgi:hypothetical protein
LPEIGQGKDYSQKPPARARTQTNFRQQFVIKQTAAPESVPLANASPPKPTEFRKKSRRSSVIHLSR